MELLDSSSQIKLVTAGAQSTHVQASYVDRSSTQDTGGTANAIIASATTTVIVDHPAGGSTRNVESIEITNVDTANQTITVQHYDGTVTSQLLKTVLLPGWMAKLGPDGDWQVLDSSGMPARSTVAGIFQRRTVLTAASGNHTTGPNTNTMVVKGVAGGGGGGGSTSVTNGRAACGGGGAGGYAEKTFTCSPNTQYAYTCGTAGIGVSAAAGGNGGDGTFIVGATTVTVKGGTGGPQCVAVNAASSFAGGAGGTVSTNGDLNCGGAPGRCGHVTVSSTTGPGASGNGGNTAYGVGGAGRNTGGNGNNALGYGAGGGGACNFTSLTARTGGNGTPGCWVVDEYS